MKTNPLAILALIAVGLAALIAVGFQLTGTSISALKDVLMVGVAVATVAGIGRGQVFTQKTTEGLVAKGLDMLPPAEPAKVAAEMVAAAKDPKKETA